MIAISKYNKQHPLRVFEAFAGYGSQSLAFKYLKDKHPEFDFKVVGYSEIEPSAIQAYGLLHGRDIPNFGDVTRYGTKATQSSGQCTMACGISKT
jgi:DNA (cytosine-5)-methyltransferase 1